MNIRAIEYRISHTEKQYYKKGDYILIDDKIHILAYAFDRLTLINIHNGTLWSNRNIIYEIELMYEDGKLKISRDNLINYINFRIQNNIQDVEVSIINKG